jgi:hypothetical protein
MEKACVYVGNIARISRVGSDVESIPRMNRVDNDVGYISWAYC